MLAKWLRLGLGSRRVTTTYPVKRTEVLRSHEQWHVLPKPIRVPSQQEGAYLVALCPTKAIQFTSEDKGARLYIDLSACIGCGRCMEATKETSLEWNPALDFAGKGRDSLVISVSAE